MPPTPTVVYETAETVTRDGVQQFKLNGICTNKGELPNKYLFLLSIVTSNDPTEDVFKRLCTIGDFDEYKADRDAAVQAGDVYFRSTSFTVFFDDVDVAAAAKTALNDRIDLLATGYAAYQSNFEDTGSDYLFPTGTVTALTALIEAYYDAWKVHDTASRASIEANAEVVRATTAFTDAETQMNELLVWEAKMQTLYDEMSEAHVDFNTFVGEAGAIVTAIQTFLTAYVAGASAATKLALPGDITTLETARSDFMDDTEIAVLKVIAANNGVGNHANQQAVMGGVSSGLIGAYVTYRGTAQLALTDATSDQLIKNQAAADKLGLLVTAYTDVRAVQSDWVPDAWFPYPGP